MSFAELDQVYYSYPAAPQPVCERESEVQVSESPVVISNPKTKYRVHDIDAIAELVVFFLIGLGLIYFVQHRVAMVS